MELAMKITVLGAAGGIGQALSLLLKMKLPAGFKLALYDVAPVTPGIAVDLSHVPTDVAVKGYAGDDLPKALEGSNVVVICAGIARKPGMDRSDLFKFNAGVIQHLVSTSAAICPQACFCIITNPVNSMVPVAAEVLKKAGVYNPQKLFGVTMLDVIRAETFVANSQGRAAGTIRVNVIGGHSGKTILPVMSQVGGFEFTDEEAAQLVCHIQDAGTEVVEAKAGNGSATLAMAAAAYRFVNAVVRGLMEEENVVECAYVEGGSQHSRFFSQPMRLGKEGWYKVLPYGPLTQAEKDALEAMLPTLRDEIRMGEDFILHPEKFNKPDAISK
jgi:malate dehydrogenase